MVAITAVIRSTKLAMVQYGAFIPIDCIMGLAVLLLIYYLCHQSTCQSVSNWKMKRCRKTRIAMNIIHSQF